jgi:hypothetical protein
MVASELAWKFVNHFCAVDWPGESLPEFYCVPRSLDEN